MRIFLYRWYGWLLGKAFLAIVWLTPTNCRPQIADSMRRRLEMR